MGMCHAKVKDSHL